MAAAKRIVVMPGKVELRGNVPLQAVIAVQSTSTSQIILSGELVPCS